MQTFWLHTWNLSRGAGVSFLSPGKQFGHGMRDVAETVDVTLLAHLKNPSKKLDQLGPGAAVPRELGELVGPIVVPLPIAFPPTVTGAAVPVDWTALPVVLLALTNE